MGGSAKQVVLDLLSTVPEAGMPVRLLLRGAEVLGIGESSVRVSLARLRADSMIESPARGEYRLGPAARDVSTHIGAWRRIEEPLEAWAGTWVAAHTGGLGRVDRTAARRRDRALRLLGLRELDRGLWIRPDNLGGGVERLRLRLRALGLDPVAPVFALSELDESMETRARGLWDVAGLEAGYEEMRGHLEEELARLPGRDLEDAARESFVLGGAAIRSIVLDPLLPDPIVNTAARAAFFDAMRRFDRAGRGVWLRLLEIPEMDPDGPGAPR